MKEPSYCGKSCLFRELNTEAFPLSVSGRPEGAWVTENRVIRVISDAGHAAGNPLHSSREPNRAERRALLKTLMERPVAHVLPVTRLCECSFETPFLEGIPLRDFGLGPDANRLTHPHNRRPAWAPEALQAFLKELASGLGALHEIGIAHGDPALMNAFVVDEKSARAAAWLDLNTARPATEENRALDAAGFIELCLWPSLLEASTYSRALFSAIADAAVRAPDVLTALCDLLSAPFKDYQSGDVRAAFASAVHSYRHLHRTDLFGGIHRALCACMAPAYFLDQTVSAQDFRFSHAVLAAEQTRHRLMEEEVTRLQYLRFHEELEAARRAAAELTAEIERLRNINRDAEEHLAELRDWLTQLQEAARYHEQQAAAAQRQLASIRSSRTWRAAERIFRWVRRLRGVARGAGMLLSARGFGQR